MGEVSGLFVATEDEINKSIGKEVYFGEILGKHSEIYGTLEEDDIEKINLDSVSVTKVLENLGKTWSGFNPLDYTQHICEKCRQKVYGEEFNLEANRCYYCMENE